MPSPTVDTVVALPGLDDAALLSTTVRLPPEDTWGEAWHRFDEKSVWALRAAIASGRPLLLRGEPGIGKSQLARAAAAVLRVPLLAHVVDERSERDELLASFDAVARLAQAQVSALVAQEDKDWREKLAEKNFVRPGVLWWAFDWSGAEKQLGYFREHCRKCEAPVAPEGWTQTAEKRLCGPVVLVDEIDKADPSVPNGLLETLANHGFRIPQTGERVVLPPGAKPPLVIITTNEERELPAAFLRRCLVHQMGFPTKREEAIRFLIERARSREEWTAEKISDNMCLKVAESLLRDREGAGGDGQAVPGAAEFLDLVRILVELHPGDEILQEAALGEVEGFALRKNSEVPV
jgi:MoxR-like ATPase